MVERVIDYFNDRVATGIQQREGLDQTFYQLLGVRGKKLDILQMPLFAKTFSGTISQENFITYGEYGKSKLHSFLWPPWILIHYCCIVLGTGTLTRRRLNWKTSTTNLENTEQQSEDLCFITEDQSTNKMVNSIDFSRFR